LAAAVVLPTLQLLSAVHPSLRLQDVSGIPVGGTAAAVAELACHARHQQQLLLEQQQAVLLLLLLLQGQAKILQKGAVMHTGWAR
jgi:hypothetical protein